MHASAGTGLAGIDSICSLPSCPQRLSAANHPASPSVSGQVLEIRHPRPGANMRATESTVTVEQGVPDGVVDVESVMNTAEGMKKPS